MKCLLVTYHFKLISYFLKNFNIILVSKVNLWDLSETKSSGMICAMLELI